MIKYGMCFLCVAVMLVTLSSCNSVAKLICKPWQITEVKFNNRTGSLSAEQQRSIEYQLKNEFAFRFRPDSVYVVIKGNDTTYGNWYLSADKKQVITKLYGGDEQISEIIKINRKEFVMHPKLDFGSLEYIKGTLPTGTK